MEARGLWRTVGRRDPEPGGRAGVKASFSEVWPAPCGYGPSSGPSVSTPESGRATSGSPRVARSS
jgi:hypothetical protein